MEIHQIDINGKPIGPSYKELMKNITNNSHIEEFNVYRISKSTVERLEKNPKADPGISLKDAKKNVKNLESKYGKAHKGQV